MAYKTVWRLNSTVEVAWGITANHGGGYQYRLCPRSEKLTEECFQRNVLPFEGGTTTLRWSNGRARFLLQCLGACRRRTPRTRVDLRGA